MSSPSAPADLTREAFDAFCEKLTATTHVEQWGGASVFKVGGKIFAIYSNWSVEEGHAVSFKCSDLSYDMLKEQPGIVPAPYLARAKWVQVRAETELSKQDIFDYITQAHTIISAKLTKKMRAELGLA